MSKIIVIGSLNMDLVISAPYMPQKGETLKGSGFMTSPGGKGANQAVAAARLNGDVYMVGCVGNDIFGNDLVDNLQRNHVNVDYVNRVDGMSTGVAIIVLADGDNRIILDSGANFELTSEIVDSAIENLAEKDDILLVQLEVPEDCIAEALRKGRNVGMKTILNPAPAPSSGLSDDIYKYVDVIIPNERECEILTGINPVDQSTCERAVSYFRDKGVNQIIITLGKNGAAYNKGNDVFIKPALKTTAVDTTAAGDSFAGALAVCLSQMMNIDEAIDFCNCTGALTITKKGAQNSLPYYKEVVKLKEDIK